VTLHERITAALDGTTPECPPVAIEKLGDQWTVEGDTLTVADARLIVSAPSLLAECARRLDPGDTDVAKVIEQVRFEAQWDASGLLAPAADLLAQVFLDPQETP